MARTFNEGDKKLDKEFRKLPKLGDVVKTDHARVRNYFGGAVFIVWDQNPKWTEQQLFMIDIEGKKALINKQELLHYLRAV